MPSGPINDPTLYKVIGGNEHIRTIVNTSEGPIEVTFTEDGTIINEFDEATIASASTDTIVSYTVPAGKELKLGLVEFSGANVASYFLEIGGTKEAQRRTWFGGDLSGLFLFNSLLIDESVVIRLRVENFRPTLADFEGRIVGALRDK